MKKQYLPPEVMAYFVALGKKNGKAGGEARAAALTPERRKEIGQKAIAARWAKKKKDG